MLAAFKESIDSVVFCALVGSLGAAIFGAERVRSWLKRQAHFTRFAALVPLQTMSAQRMPQPRALRQVRHLLEALPDAALYIWKGQLHYSNPAAQHLLGSPSALVLALLRNSGNTQHWLQRADGSGFMAQVHRLDLGGDGGFFILIRECAVLTDLESSAFVLRQFERERQHLASELHDDIGQQLIGLKFLSHALSELAPAEHPARERCFELVRVVDDTLMRVRSLSHDLYAPALESWQLETAISQRIAQLQDYVPTALSFSLIGSLENLQADQSLVIYRVFQESLSNALRHAHASCIQVQLRADAHTWILEVQDDGLGFDYPSTTHLAGLGLSSMQARALSLGGVLDIASAPQQGTRVTLKLPAISRTV